MSTRGTKTLAKSEGGKEKSRPRGEGKSKRQLAKERRRRNRIILYAVLSLIAVAVLAGIAFVVANSPDDPAASAGQPVGRAVPIMQDTSHYPEGQTLPAHNSNPPTSGPHYASTYEVGFYDEERAATLPRLPEGHLVHNLEHGYVIFWYNCELLDEQACTELKEQIQEVMEQADNFKVIGFPWPSIDKPVVMTSWGRMLEFDAFDPEQALQFVLSNRNKAPEPNAP